jgi:dihydrodipicolinate synthase/N-acetylneuraminate lyase
MKKLKGVIPALIMPFKENGEINEASLKEFIEFLIDKKVNGFYTLGTFGCGPLLSLEERKKAMWPALEFRRTQKSNGANCRVCSRSYSDHYSRWHYNSRSHC